MTTISELPAEILAQIVRYANLNGDVPNLRLSNSRILALADSQTHLLLDDLCFRYGISARVRDLYLSQKAGERFSRTRRPNIIHVMAFGNFLRMTGLLAADLDRGIRQPTLTGVPPSQLGNREPFLLFAIFSQVLNSSLEFSHSTIADLLAPSPDAGHLLSKQFSEKFVHFLRQELALEELEGIIGAISVCSMRLWGTVFLFRPRDSTISSFGSLSGASFNTNQAILTEHVIWKGPLWASRILRVYGPADAGSTQETKMGAEVDDNLVREGVWRGTRCEGARLAANGVARLLWKERQQKIDAKASAAAERTSIADLRIDASVWRGSSGGLYQIEG
ncbi:uncharacterized protein Z519_04054 [Cladophialophora bantiana CBS 173.52]|uniref:F-box domain-containing protein n=1 Tax=Cladophialophora bantiana (strain ATCC 10958 / CBS 173.52 / CDC B-1940 / NIH 8579) TaxID=1442370 RepID=A0A0D2IFB8_CLAB1|nr:uncharacterized protein Z519_04054 [Cladophialophora bantiana CBS 173.52]KIW95469.1 hypothetical protein Z519_04054 [Cladophialophora bantiana CBS 173.52]